MKRSTNEHEWARISTNKNDNSCSFVELNSAVSVKKRYRGNKYFFMAHFPMRGFMIVKAVGVAGLCVGFAWLLGAGAARPQAAGADKEKVEDITFQAAFDGTPQKYMIRLPAPFDPHKPCDLLITLHGHGSDRKQGFSDRAEFQAAQDIAAKYGMFQVSPDYRAATSWMGPAAEADVAQIITALKEQYKIKRVFLAGASMGGASSLTFTALHPDLIDGVCSMNGLANHLEYTQFQDAIAASFGGSKEQVPEEYKKRSAEFFPKKFTMPLSITAGGRDTTVPPQSVLRLARLVHQQKGGRAFVIFREDGGHSTTYEDARQALEFIVAGMN